MLKPAFLSVSNQRAFLLKAWIRLLKTLVGEESGSSRRACGDDGFGSGNFHAEVFEEPDGAVGSAGYHVRGLEDEVSDVIGSVPQHTPSEVLRGGGGRSGESLVVGVASVL